MQQSIMSEKERRWLAESKDALASINAFIERHGLLSERLRYRPKREHA